MFWGNFWQFFLSILLCRKGEVLWMPTSLLDSAGLPYIHSRYLPVSLPLNFLPPEHYSVFSRIIESSVSGVKLWGCVLALPFATLCGGVMDPKWEWQNMPPRLILRIKWIFMHKVFISIQKELKIIIKILVFGKSSSWVIFGSGIMFSVFSVVVIF